MQQGFACSQQTEFLCFPFTVKRLTNSMRRLEMPGADFDNDELIKLIGELVKLDKDWIPSGEGYSLYIRPTVIASHSVLGLAAPESILLYVICSPVGPYYKTGFDPIKLTADTQFVRAWPGGTGKLHNIKNWRRREMECSNCERILHSRRISSRICSNVERCVFFLSFFDYH